MSGLQRRLCANRAGRAACNIAVSFWLVLACSTSAADTQALRDELRLERQKVAEQMQQLQRQMADYQRQVERIDELERRLDASAGDSVADAASGDGSAVQVVDARPAVAKEQGAELADGSEDRPLQQVLAAEGRADAFSDDSFAKSIPLFGSQWRFSFGGYAKTDLIYDFSGTGNKQEFVLSTIPVDNNPSEGSYANLQASETRFHFESRNSDPRYANNRFYVEFDFFDEQNTSSTRLRHAYFEYGKILAGRTWTLLTDLRQLPQLLDFAAGDSILGGRTEQLRWSTANEDKTFGWAVAVENFDDSQIYNPLGFDGRARSDIPRLTAGFTRMWDRVTWSAGGALTQLRFDGDGATDDATDLAYTLTTAGRVYLDGTKQHWLGLGVGYQAGSVNDVVTFANGRIPNAALDMEGDLDVTKSWNTQIGLHWTWNRQFSSNFNFAYADLTDVPELLRDEPDLIRTGWSYHANVIYQYNALLSGGMEFMHGKRENLSGRDGDANRLQMSVMYNF